MLHAISLAGPMAGEQILSISPQKSKKNKTHNEFNMHSQWTKARKASTPWLRIDSPGAVQPHGDGYGRGSQGHFEGARGRGALRSY